MKKFNLKNIMTRAWSLVKTIGVTISAALKTAWKEAKNMLEKITYNGNAKVVCRPELDDDDTAKFLTFKEWVKGSYHRIYINDYKGRSIGFIDYDTKDVTINDRQGLSELELQTAIDTFFETYEFANNEVQKIQLVDTRLSNDEVEGLRVYVDSRDTYKIKKYLQSLGFVWDCVARCWYKTINAKMPKEIIAETKAVNESLKNLAENVRFDSRISNMVLRAYKESLA